MCIATSDCNVNYYERFNFLSDHHHHGAMGPLRTVVASRSVVPLQAFAQQFKKIYTHTQRATRSSIKRLSSKRIKDEHTQTEKNGVDDD